MAGITQYETGRVVRSMWAEAGIQFVSNLLETGGRIIGLRGIDRRNGHKRRQHVPDGLRVDAGRVPGHHPTRLESSHP